MADRPDYIYQGGSVLMHSPLQLKDSEMFGFFVKGDMAKLQHSVDTTLNRVASGRKRFKVLSPFVMLTFTRVNHASSTVPVDHNKGWGEETDIVTWIMVGEMAQENGWPVLKAIYSYPFHIWVNDCMALINGRELYGYPKYECQYTMPATGTDPDHFTLVAKGFQPFGPTTQLAMHPLLEVVATNKSKPHRPLSNFLELMQEGFTIMKSEPDFLDLDLNALPGFIKLLFHPEVQQIFLKQFPDSSGIKAVYQAIIVAPARVDSIKSVSLLGYEYQCTLHEFATFPLNETLGFALGAQPAILPFHVNLDFTVTEGVELINNSQIQPEKIAILGGGVSAMTAAFYLTDQPGWQNNYDITLYQMGWRLGGKGASGRNPQYGQRIEEHGLHIWFGFYDNAFGMMQKAYGLLQRPPGAPLQTWQDAFKPQHFVALTELIKDQWKIWPIDTPLIPGTPGHHNEQLSLWQMASALLAWIKKMVVELHAHRTKGHTTPVASAGAGGLISRMVRNVEHGVANLVEDVEDDVHALLAFIKDFPEMLREQDGAQHGIIRTALGNIKRWIEKEIADELDQDDELRRLFIMVDLGVVCMVGMLEDGVLTKGFDEINDIDFYKWLVKHGANEKYTAYSAPVRGFYDLVFAFEGGDTSKPNIEAGTMLRGMMKVAFCYHGGMMWKMQAGMGDTIFTPLYQVLKQRGVKFKFFHKVEELVPDGDQVGEIRITQQVTLNTADASYNPLVPVKGLDCWPRRPNYSQIDASQAALLQANDVNLESHWSDWPALYQQKFGQPLPSLTLKRGVDFDKVVFGISVASIPSLCPKLLALSPALKTTTEKVQAVVTEAYQVWLNQDIKQLGWNTWPDDGQEPVLSGFTEPLDTWAPMDQLLDREDWPASLTPKNVSYFCSAMAMTEFPPPDDHGFPARSKALVKQDALNQLQQSVHWLWPNAATANSFNWALLLDPENKSGPARFDSQFWRANIDPSERYVISLVGSSKYRLTTDGSGFKNLYLVGDWIKTGLNAGCVEAATMAGMQASRAICGYPAEIKGEKDI